MPDVRAKPIADIVFSKQVSQAVNHVTAIRSPTKQEQSEFYMKLAQVNKPKLSVVLSVQPEHCKLFVPATRSSKYPAVLITIYDTAMISASHDDVSMKCETIYSTYSVTESQIMNLERDTRQQSNTKLWFAHRARRVTASVLKQSLHTNFEKPSISLIRKLCYPLTSCFHSTATK
jgi:hypothetical protein